MGTTSDKLTYLNTTKGKIKDVINLTGANITSDTTFRNYATKLYDGYVSVLKDKNTLLDNMPKGTSTGAITDAADLPIYEDKMSKESTQETTTGKNIFNPENISGTKNGITYSYDSDTQIYTLNGTVTSNETLINFIAKDTINLTNGSPTLSVHYVSGSATGGIVQFLTSNYAGLSVYLSNLSSSNPILSHTSTTTGTTTKFNSRFRFMTGDTLDNLKIKIMVANTTDTSYEPYTGGQPSPSPNYPQEIKTVKGYRNLFDKTSSNYFNTYIGSVSHAITNIDSERYRTIYIPIEGGKNYTITKKYGRTLSMGTSIELPYKGLELNDYVVPSNNLKHTINTSSSANYLIVFIYSNVDYDDNLSIDDVINTLLITEGTEELPYVPYGNNYIAITNTNGTDTNYYTIPLNDNEIAGIGNYKDELIVDKNGKCWLNKKIGKVIVKGDENITLQNTVNNISGFRIPIDENVFPSTKVMSNYYINVSFDKYFSSRSYGEISAHNNSYINIIYMTSPNNTVVTVQDIKTWLSAHNTKVYYVLATENLIDLNYTVDLTLFEGINNISNSDDMDMEIKYIKDTYE